MQIKQFITYYLLKELLHDPIDIQLKKLLGSEAEDFLHPTFREGAKKTLNPVVVKRKCM